MAYGLRVAEKLILVAFEIEMSGKKRFSAEDLVVSAWKNSPMHSVCRVI